MTSDIAQTTLLSVIIALSLLLLILGIQAFFVLKDLRQIISKTKKLLDNANSITESVLVSASSLSSLAAAIKTSISLINFFKRNQKTKDKK